MKNQLKIVFYAFLFVLLPVLVGMFFLDLFLGLFRLRDFQILFAFLLCFLAMAIWVIFRFDRQASALDRAARKIIEGDFDYNLDLPEKNEFSGLTRTLERLREKMKEEQARRFSFLMAVSHDLNTPLTSIKGYLEAMTDGLVKDPAQWSKYLEIMQEKTFLLEERIQELIDYVKTEAGDWRIHPEEVLLFPFLSALGESYKHDASVISRDFECRIDLDENIYVMADGILLGRVFENLFGNAFRYTKPGDKISFVAESSSREILVSIRDSGIGIEEGKLPFIFDPFYRASPTRSEEGQGLGLSTVKNILRAHDWAVEVKSVIGRGSVFTIRMAPYFFKKGHH